MSRYRRIVATTAAAYAADGARRARRVRHAPIHHASPSVRDRAARSARTPRAREATAGDVS